MVSLTTATFNPFLTLKWKVSESCTVAVNFTISSCHIHLKESSYTGFNMLPFNLIYSPLVLYFRNANLMILTEIQAQSSCIDFTA